MFAEIIINSNAKALNKIFDYKVPKHLEEKAKAALKKNAAPSEDDSNEESL